ncbi:MAG: twin-arginine translocation signal domain-containing protein, partial [Terriglobia bacterium]
MPNHLTRRAFLGQTGTIAALAAANPPLWGRPDSSSSRPMRLGGPIFLKSEDPGELAQEHRRLGYRAAYAPQVPINDTERIKAIIKEFAARDVALAEVGAWRNMLDPDLEKRRQNLAYVQERLALAEALGARCCVDIAGYFNPLHWDGPDPKN